MTLSPPSLSGFENARLTASALASKETDLHKMQESSSAAPKDEEAISLAAKEFESLFASEMLKPLFNQIKTNEMFGGGRGEEVFRGFLIEEYGKKIADSGAFGLSSLIKDQLIALQSKNDDPSSKI